MRLLSRIPASLSISVAVLAVLMAVVFLFLTQTQLGRDEVARQIERQFDAEFEGSLTVGRLSGNLAWDLLARDVVVRDPDGNVVLSIDSVVIHPHWRSLLSREFEIRAMQLHGLNADLVQGDAGWNLAAAFARQIPREKERSAFDLNVTNVRVSEGSISTTSAGPAPPEVSSGAVFDYTNARMASLAGQFRIRSTRSGLSIRALSVSADLPDHGTAIRRLDGRLHFGPDGPVGDRLRLSLNESEIAGSFTAADGRLVVDLTRSRLVTNEVRRFIPAIPLHEGSVVTLVARGPVSDLEIGEMSINGGDSRIAARGSVRGLPEKVDYELAVNDISVTSGDLRAAFPLLLPPGADPGTITGQMDLAGTVRWASGLSVLATAGVDLSAAAGTITGRLGFASANGGPPSLEMHVATGGLDLARVTGDRGMASSITGRFEASGTGSSLLSFDGALAAALDGSVLAGTRVKGLRTDISLRDGRLTGDAILDNGGLLAAEGFIDLATRQADLSLEAQRLDLRSFAPGAPATALSGRASVAAAGSTLDDLVADLSLSLNESTLVTADSTWLLPEYPLALSVRPSNPGGTRLRLESDAVLVDVAGDFRWADLATAGEYWAGRIADVVEADLLPRMGEARAPVTSRDVARPDVSPQPFVLTARVLRPDALQPWISELSANSAVSVSGRISGEELSAQIVGTVGDLSVGGLRLENASGYVGVDVGDAVELLDHLRIDARITSSLQFAANGSPAPASLDLAYDPERRALSVDAHYTRASDSLAAALNGDVSILPDRHRLIGDFVLEAPGQSWRVHRGEIDLFADALRFVSFRALRNGADGPGERSVLTLEGLASANPEDRLHVHGTDISLGSILQLISDELPFDGIAAADFEVSGLLGQPAIVGQASVEEFTVWGDHAGRVEATSEVVAGREGFNVDLRLLPAEHGTHVRNEGYLRGSLRLPDRRVDGRRRDPGFFDLRFALDRLDMFIFDHLFPEIVAGARGGATGSGSITGDWSYPVFTAGFEVDDARANVPAFNLGIAASGRVDIDRQGVHLRGIQLADKIGGSGVVNGSILFNEYRYFSFDLAASLQEFEVIDVAQSQAGMLPFYGNIRTSGNATLTGPMDNVFLHSPDAVTTPDSRLFIPVTAAGPAADAGFLVFTDSEGRLPEPEARRHLVAERPEYERPFLEGLDMLLNVRAPHGSTVHLVFDPSVGDVINAVGSANLQLAITEGQFQMFGTFDVDRGDYLFTAGQIFTRRFDLDAGGALVWDGDPGDARLDLPAAYRTRASLAGLGLTGVDERQRVPIVVGLQVGGRVSSPLVDLSIDLDESAGRTLTVAEPLRRRLNEPDRQAEYATSVLLTNTFLLSPTDPDVPIARAADDLLYTSLSELVSARLNLFLNQALAADYLDVAVGVQQGTNLQDLDLTYGLALRLLDERLIIRGEGVYHQLENRPANDALQGEVAVELRISDSVSLEVFYRRENDLLLASGVTGALTEAYGAGVNYQAQFTGWRSLFERIFEAAREPERREPASRVIEIAD